MEKSALKQVDLVVLRRALQGCSLVSGDGGTVVVTFRGGETCNVEFGSMDDTPVAIVTLRAEQIERATGRQTSRSRQRQPARGYGAMARHRAVPLPADIESRIEEATRRLVAAAHPLKIVLFGSYARGDFDQGSDIDLLVILPTVTDRFEEMIRLESVLRGLRLPVEIIVYSANQVAERRHLRGTMLYHALAEGRVLYDAA